MFPAAGVSDKFPPSYSEKKLGTHVLQIQHPHIRLTLQFSRTLVYRVAYRFPAVLCSRVSFRLSVRRAVSPVTVGGSALLLLHIAPYLGALHRPQFLT